eukprot:7448905-Pyramimonas_sp.AAC.1
MRRRGWRAVMTAASPTRAGGAAGALLQYVPQATGLSEMECTPSTLADGRARVLHCAGVTPNGFLWIT